MSMEPSADIVKQLQDIVGQANVLVDRDRMEGYSHDETSVDRMRRAGGRHDPDDDLAVARIMKLADKHRIGNSRGADQARAERFRSWRHRPFRGKMASIVEVDEANLTVTASGHRYQRAQQPSQRAGPVFRRLPDES